MPSKPNAPKPHKSSSKAGSANTAETHQTVEKLADSLTTNHGIPISDNQNSLRAGLRGPTLIEDFVLREKITHFDHERIPERIVHARGSGAHGYFQVYDSLRDITKAAFLQDPKVKTEVFARFSTVAGGAEGCAGIADEPRCMRGRLWFRRKCRPRQKRLPTAHPETTARTFSRASAPFQKSTHRGVLHSRMLRLPRRR